MGGTVKQAVQPIAQAANKAVEGVKDIASGRVGEGLKEVGGAYVDALKGSYGVSADNKLNLEKTGKTALAEFSSNPAGFVAAGAEAYASGGASLVPAAGSSILSGAFGGGATPGQLAKGGGGGAPVLQGEADPIYFSGAAKSDFTAPVLVVGAMLTAYVLIKRRA